jgi:hypothetical protein
VQEISGVEYLKTHSDSQIRRDFMHFLKMAISPQPRTVSSFYAGLLPESMVIQADEEVMGHQTDTCTMTKGGGSDLTPAFTNMLEVLFYMTEASKESGYRQHQGTRLYLFHGRSYEEIGKLLGCHERTVERDIAQVIDWAIHWLKEDARRK